MSEFNSISLYFCPLSQPLLDAQISRLQGYLSQGELEKIAGYRRDEMKRQSLIVRGMLRMLLSKHSHISPEQWSFEYGKKGKPRLTAKLQAETQLDFNLSHSGDWLLIGIIEGVNSSCELGVDIERERTKTDIYPILKHYFAHQEVTELMSLEESLRRERFFDLWALKEAYIKAKGLGLALSLQSFYFDFSSTITTSLLLIQESECISELALDTNINIVMQQPSVTALSGEVTHQQTVHGEATAGSYGESTKNSKAMWGIYLGRLDLQYRFGIALANYGQKRIQLKAVRIDIASMLDG